MTNFIFNLMRYTTILVFTMLGAFCLLLMLCYYGQAVAVFPAVGVFACLAIGFMCLECGRED